MIVHNNRNYSIDQHFCDYYFGDNRAALVTSSALPNTLNSPLLLGEVLISASEQRSVDVFVCLGRQGGLLNWRREFLAPCALIDGVNWVGQGSPKGGGVCVGDAWPQPSAV